jgi:hypothetical protein
MDWTSPEVVERAGFNAEQAIFMQNTSEQIKKKGLPTHPRGIPAELTVYVYQR